jgi:RNA polymerase-binding transcription factor DksA
VLQSPERTDAPASPQEKALALLPYMGEAQKKYLRRLLSARIAQARQDLQALLRALQDARPAAAQSDSADLESSAAQGKDVLIRALDALRRLDTDPGFGYCLRTGEPIGFLHLCADPTAQVAPVPRSSLR